MKKIVFASFVIVLFYMLLTNCAQTGAPMGGLKDTIAPVFVGSKPENYAKNFDKQKVTIEFNEFFVLKNIGQKFVVSPPLKEKPDVRTRDKSIVIDLKNPLKDSTTYTLDFGDAIADLNEGNLIPSFQFVFSTGNDIDSLAVGGKVLDAFNLKPVEGVFVMLYENFSDSTPCKTIPDFVSKTNKTGDFMVRNIRKTNYHAFALKDINSNLIFDQPTEAIAFRDSLVVPSATRMVLPDTLFNKKDSTKIDTIVYRLHSIFKPNNLKMLLFQEDFKKQFLLASNRKEREKCTFIFNKGLDKNFKITPFNFTIHKDSFFIERSFTNDTISYWLTDTLLSKHDSLKFILAYEKLDSLKQVKTQIDTILMKYSIAKEQKAKKKKTDENTKNSFPFLSLKVSVEKNTMLDLGGNVVIESDYPISKLDVAKFHLFEVQEDKKEVPLQFSLKQDTTTIRRYVLSTKWLENTSYKLTADSAAVYDILGKATKNLIYNFKTQKEDFYGIIKLRIAATSLQGAVIVQLLNERETIIREMRYPNFYAFQSVEFQRIKPSKYKLKLIVDSNNNGKWDTGNYLKKLQPEPVYYYRGEILVKSNWDTVLDWKIE